MRPEIKSVHTANSEIVKILSGGGGTMGKIV